MQPKNYKQFIKPVAEKLGYSESLVEDVIGFYYSKTRKAISSFKGARINIPCLGTFSVMPKRLQELIDNLEKQVEALGKYQTLAKTLARQEVEKNLEKAKNILKLLDEEKQRKIDFQLRKEEYFKRKNERLQADNSQ